MLIPIAISVHSNQTSVHAFVYAGVVSLRMQVKILLLHLERYATNLPPPPFSYSAILFLSATSSEIIRKVASLLEKNTIENGYHLLIFCDFIIISIIIKEIIANISSTFVDYS